MIKYAFVHTYPDIIDLAPTLGGVIHNSLEEITATHKQLNFDNTTKIVKVMIDMSELEEVNQ